MKFNFLKLFSVIFFLILSPFSIANIYESPELLSNNHLRGKVVNVVDGDTVDVELDLGFEIKKTARVRILKVDTPELRGSSSSEKKHAKEASKFTSDKVSGKQVLVVGNSDDVYGRLLADIYYQENGKLILLSEQLKVNGFSKKKTYE